MATEDLRPTNREPWYLIVPRTLIWCGAALVAIGPLTSTAGAVTAAIAAVGGVLSVWLLFGSRVRWWWMVAAGVLVLAAGWIGQEFVGASESVAWSLGPGRTLALIEVILFGSLVLGAALILRSLTVRYPACGFLEAAAIVTAVAHSFRGHRQYPFSQPQILSDWAFANGYDPRHILLAIGVATLVGMGLLLLPRQGIRRLALATVVLLLLTWLCVPFLFGPMTSDVAQAMSQSAANQPPQKKNDSNNTPPPESPSPESPNRIEEDQPGEDQPGDASLDRLPRPRPGFTKPRPNHRPPPPPPPPPDQEPEDLPKLTIDDVQIEEANAGKQALTFRVKLSEATNRPVTVNYRSQGGTAGADDDYDSIRGTLTIPAGQTQATLSVDVNGDETQESDETFFVALSNPVHATLDKDQGAAVITDDDKTPEPPTISIADAQIKEGDAGVAALAMKVTLSKPTRLPVTVKFSSVDGTAKDGEDFGLGPATLTIPPGQTEAIIAVRVNGDQAIEPDETLTVQLSEPTNAVLARDAGQGTIVNDDHSPEPPSLSISDQSIVEGDEETSVARHTVQLSRPHDQAVTVKYTTAPNSATVGEDFQPTQGEVTLAPGHTSAHVDVRIVGDEVVERDESLVVRLFEPVNATLAKPDGACVIVNDDVIPEVSIADAEIKEGDVGPTRLAFEVTLSEPTRKAVHVDYAASAGTARTDEDFHAARGTVSFAPGEIAQQLTVIVNGDRDIEPDETFAVQLSQPVRCTLKRAQATGLIINDDEYPKLSIEDSRIVEGHEAATPLGFTVRLSKPWHEAVVVQYKTESVAATTGLARLQFAKPDEDFRPVNASLTFRPGTVEAKVGVAVVGDRKAELDEKFTVRLFTPSHATLLKPQAEGVIVNDDPYPKVSIVDGQAKEGDAGTTALVFKITLDRPSETPVKVNYKTVDGTAKAGEDFESTQGTLTIPPGETQATLSVPIMGDKQKEPMESFSMQLDAPENSELDRDQATGSIDSSSDDDQVEPDDDDPPEISISKEVESKEGNAGVTPFTFVVTLSKSTSKEVTVQYKTATKTATADDQDFTELSDTLKIPPGATQANITVEVNGDTQVEPDETFEVQLSEPSHGTLKEDEQVGTGKITNDDQPTITIEDARVDEGDKATTDAKFVVVLSAASDKEVQVTYETVAGSAKPPVDFVAAKGVLKIAPGETKAQITIKIVADKIAEPQRTFEVKLTKPVNAKVERDTAVGTIVNDDDPKLRVEDVKLPEGHAGETAFAFRVTLTPATSKVVEVRCQTTPGTATAAEDFRAVDEVLTIEAGKTEAIVTVQVAADTKIERDETFEVRLSAPKNATLERDRAAGTIVNDDRPTLSIGDVQINEGNEKSAPATFKVSVSEPHLEVIQVKYAAARQTAEPISDFVAASKVLMIPAGATQASATIAVVGDGVAELDETFEVALSEPVNATLDRATGVATIVNDDQPTISVEAARREEGHDGKTQLAFPVRLSSVTSKPVEVSYRTIAGTAEEASDFEPAQGILKIESGMTAGEVVVNVLSDTKIERDESFELVLSDPKNATLANAKAAGTIVNDDRPSLVIGDATVTEQNDGSQPAELSVALSEPYYEEVHVMYETMAGTAQPDTDFVAVKQRLSIPAGVVDTKIVIGVIGDTLVEPDETFEVRFFEPINATIQTATGACTIINDDLPTLSLEDAKAEEGHAGRSLLTLPVKVSAAMTKPITVKYLTDSRTALKNIDFTDARAVLEIPAGVTEAVISVEIKGDTDVEADEAFSVYIYEPTNATILRNRAVGTIVNDDFLPPPPALSIDTVIVDEGQAGTTPVVFAVKLSAAAKGDVSVRYAAVGETAEAKTDFQPAEGILTIPAGQTQANFTVQIVGDTVIERDETLRVDLSSPNGVALPKTAITATIRNDDQSAALANLSIDDVRVDEGHAGLTELKFTVSLSSAAQQEVQVDYAMGGGSAYPQEDYQSTTGTLAIPAGQKSVTLAVKIVGDNVAEPDETFVVQLAQPRQANLLKDQGIGTIVNDDGAGGAASEDEFNWAATGSLARAPRMLVKFLEDYDPVEKGFYFRTFAYSQLHGARLVRDEARDKDIAWVAPAGQFHLPARTPQDTLRDLSWQAYGIGTNEHENVPALIQTVSIAPRENPLPEQFSSAFDVTSQVLAHATRDGRRRDAFSEVAAAAVGDPNWDEATRNHYLAYPDNPRYLELSQKIVNTLAPRQRTSPLARMIAIRKWMEDNLIYDYNAAHASAADPTASFLFGDRRGYCTHLAHAMTYLLRAQGIPARVAAGYRVGPDRRGQRRGVLVYTTDAHAWSEMYVDGFGWVVVEAGTKGSQAQAESDPDPRELDYYLSLLSDLPPEVFSQGSLSATQIAALGIPVSVGGALLILYLIKFWRLLIPVLAGPNTLHRLGYRSLLDLLAAVGFRRQFGETWDEFSERVSAIAPEFDQLTEIHLRRSFDPESNKKSMTLAEMKSWRTLQQRLMYQIVKTAPPHRLWLAALNPVSWMGVG